MSMISLILQNQMTPFREASPIVMYLRPCLQRYSLIRASSVQILVPLSNLRTLKHLNNHNNTPWTNLPSNNSWPETCMHNLYKLLLSNMVPTLCHNASLPNLKVATVSSLINIRPSTSNKWLTKLPNHLLMQVMALITYNSTKLNNLKEATRTINLTITFSTWSS